jgi:hypothetical protein
LINAKKAFLGIAKPPVNAACLTTFAAAFIGAAILPAPFFTAFLI